MQTCGCFVLIMPSEKVGIWGSIVYMTIYLLEIKTSSVVLNALKLFIFMFLYFIQDQ